MLIKEILWLRYIHHIKFSMHDAYLGAQSLLSIRQSMMIRRKEPGGIFELQRLDGALGPHVVLSMAAQ
jgi:hypothetical protein